MASNPELALMTRLLKIPGIKVKNYQIKEGIGIFLYLESKQKKVVCPSCGQFTDKLHQNHRYTVRDLPLGEEAVYLEVNRRRMRCAHCSHIFSEKLEWVPQRRTYTERFRQKIAREVLESDIKNVAQRNGLSEQEVETMLKDLAEELLTKKPQGIVRLGIDEIAWVKGQKNYCTVLVDLDKKTIVGILPKRTKKVISEFLKSWGEEVLGQVKEVSIDLWKAYKNIAKELMPQAEIIADRFHVMKQVNEELDRARKQTKRAAEKLKNSQQKLKILSGLTKSKYALLKNESDLKQKEKDKLKEVQEVAPKLGEMHQLKEKFRQIFETSQDWVEGLFGLSDWLKEATKYFPKSSKTIRRWIGEIIAYFDQRTSQGVVEGINNKLKLIKRRAYGFRNFDNFHIRSLLTWYFAA